MSFNGSGVFSLSQPSFVSGTVIASATMNNVLNDIAANGFDLCVTRDGQGQMTSQFKIVDGSSSVPGIAFNAETSTGLYRASAGVLNISTQGVVVASFSSAQTTISSLGSAVATFASTGSSLPAPASGTTLTLTGLSGGVALQVNSGASTNTTAGADVEISRSVLGTANATLPSQGANIALICSNGGTTYGTNIQNSGGQTEIWQYSAGSWGQVANWNSNKALTLQAPPGTGTPTLIVSTPQTGYGTLATSTLYLANTSSSGQTAIAFGSLSGAITGNIRSDYVGNITYASFLSGGHYFFVGGDSGAGSQVLSITSTGIGVSTQLVRTGTTGYMDGGYNPAGPGETGTTAGCIYTIGTGSYRPNTGTTNALGTMYGCGVTTSSATAGTGSTISATIGQGLTTGKWGLYTASGGIPRIFLDSDDGVVYASAAVAAGQFNCGGLNAMYNAGDGWLRMNNSGSFSNGIYTPTNFRADGSIGMGGSFTMNARGSSYGSLQINGNAQGGYYGVVIADGGLTPTLMSNTTSMGVYCQSGFWSWIDTASGPFTISHGVSAPSYSISSDSRLKENVETITGALDKVSQLRGVTFTWNDKSGDKRGQNSIGLIAQEVEQVVPELVGEFQITQEGTPDLGETYKNVQYGNIVALLIEAVKDLKAKNEALEDRLFALETK